MNALLKIIPSLHHIEFCARDTSFPFYVILSSNITYVKGQQQNCLPRSELTRTHTQTRICSLFLFL